MAVLVSSLAEEGKVAALHIFALCLILTFLAKQRLSSLAFYHELEAKITPKTREENVRMITGQ